MGQSGEQMSPMRFTREAAKAVAAAVAEVLPNDSYWVTAHPDHGHDGVRIVLNGSDLPPGESDPHWYFDNTFGGEDGYSEHLRVYFTSSNAECFDDLNPAGAPRIDADPIEIARWIVGIVNAGPPRES